MKAPQKKDSIWRVFAIIGLVGGLAAAVLVQNAQDIRRRAGLGPATMGINPPSQDKNVDETGIFYVAINPNGSQVESVEIVIDYDPLILEALDVVPGEFFTSVSATVGEPIETVKDLSTPGRIHYALGFPGGYTSDQVLDVAVVSFKGIAEGASAISFVTGTDPQTRIFDGVGQDVFDSATDGIINVFGGARLHFSDPNPVNPQVLGNTFSVDLLVDTAGQEIEGVDAKLFFDPAFLQITDINQGSEPAFVSYPALRYNNNQGTAVISANIGGTVTTGLVGTNIHLGTIVFSTIAQTPGTDILYEYQPGGRNDSNIVLFGTKKGKDSVDILSSVETLSIVIGEVVPTPTPTTPPTPSPSPSPGPTTPPTPSPSPVPQPQDVTIKLLFQGRSRLGASNEKTLTFQYQIQGGSISDPINIATNQSGEFATTLDEGVYTFLFDATGYLAKKYENVNIILGNPYLDLTIDPLLGGDFNDDGEINEVDYTLHFLPNFLLDTPLVDLDGSGEVNNLDFSIMRASWNLIDDAF